MIQLSKHSRIALLIASLSLLAACGSPSMGSRSSSAPQQQPTRISAAATQNIDAQFSISNHVLIARADEGSYHFKLPANSFVEIKSDRSFSVEVAPLRANQTYYLYFSLDAFKPSDVATVSASISELSMGSVKDQLSSMISKEGFSWVSNGVTAFESKPQFTSGATGRIIKKDVISEMMTGLLGNNKAKTKYYVITILAYGNGLRDDHSTLLRDIANSATYKPNP